MINYSRWSNISSHLLDIFFFIVVPALWLKMKWFKYNSVLYGIDWFPYDLLAYIPNLLEKLF